MNITQSQKITEPDSFGIGVKKNQNKQTGTVGFTGTTHNFVLPETGSKILF